MYGKFCGRRTIEGHGELSFSKDILNVCHKPGKVLGTRGCSSEHIKDKNVFTWGKEGTQTQEIREGFSVEVTSELSF